MKFSFLFIWAVFCTPLFPQKNNSVSGPRASCNWDNVCLDKSYTPTTGDTCLLVASIRNYDAARHEFVDYDYDTTGTIKYFAVYFNGNQWNAVPHASLNELLQQKQAFGDFVIFTEGLGKTFTSGVDRATRLMRAYHISGLYFDWPTARPYMRSGKNIKVTSRVAPKAARAYAVFLKEFETYKNTHSEKFKTVTLFFHSMGNLLMMYNLKSNALNGLSPTLVNSVILNAACVNQTDHKEWLDNLSFTNQIYITINDKDMNLRGASIIFRDHQLGERPKKIYSEKANYINFSHVLSNEHNYYIVKQVLEEKPFLKKFYEDVFAGKEPEKNYPKALLKKKSKIN